MNVFHVYLVHLLYIYTSFSICILERLEVYVEVLIVNAYIDMHPSIVSILEVVTSACSFIMKLVILRGSCLMECSEFCYLES